MFKVFLTFVLTGMMTSCSTLPAGRGPAAEPVVEHPQPKNPDYRIGKIKCTFEKEDPLYDLQDKAVSFALFKSDGTIIARADSSESLAPLRWRFPQGQISEQDGTIVFTSALGYTNKEGFASTDVLSVSASGLKLETISKNKNKKIPENHRVRECELQGYTIDINALSNWLHAD